MRDQEDFRADERGYTERGLKDLRLADWAARREGVEDPKFVRLCFRLKSKKYRGILHAEGGERLARYLELRRGYCKAWRQADPERARRLDRGYKHAKHRAEAKVYACTHCGAQWCRVPWARSGTSKFCSTRCYDNYSYKHNEARRAQKKRIAAAWKAKKKAVRS